MSAHGSVRHEGRDIQPRAIRRAGVLLLAMTVGAMLILIPFFRTLEWASAGADVAPGPLAYAPDRLPPEPRLQSRPTQELKALRAEEETLLEEYGWVDRDAGLVRIPIERAMELVLERAGVRSEAPPAEGGVR